MSDTYSVQNDIQYLHTVLYMKSLYIVYRDLVPMCENPDKSGQAQTHTSQSREPASDGLLTSLEVLEECCSPHRGLHLPRSHQK